MYKSLFTPSRLFFTIVVLFLDILSLYILSVVVYPIARIRRIILVLERGGQHALEREDGRLVVFPAKVLWRPLRALFVSFLALGTLLILNLALFSTGCGSITRADRLGHLLPNSPRLHLSTTVLHLEWSRGAFGHVQEGACLLAAVGGDIRLGAPLTLNFVQILFAAAARVASDITLKVVLLTRDPSPRRILNGRIIARGRLDV